MHQRKHSADDAKRHKVAANRFRKKRKAPIPMIRAAPPAKQASNASSGTRHRLPAGSREPASQNRISVRIRRLTNKMDGRLRELGAFFPQERNNAAVVGMVERDRRPLNPLTSYRRHSAASVVNAQDENNRFFFQAVVSECGAIRSRRKILPSPHLRSFPTRIPRQKISVLSRLS